MTDFKITQNGTPLDQITMSEEFKQNLQSKGLRTLEQVLGVMLSVPEAVSAMCKQYGATYDALKQQIYKALPPATVKRLEDDSVNPPQYGIGAFPKR